MSWAKHAKKALREGQTATVRPRGHSMDPKVKDGALVTLRPVGEDPITAKVGDVVLVKVKGRDYLHLIKAKRGNQFLIGNNRGRINGWVHSAAVYGVATEIEQ